MYFLSPPRIGRPSQVQKLALLYTKVTHMISINREAPSLIWTHCKLKEVRSKEEKDKFTSEEEEEGTLEDILSLGFLP